jgi:hypothetical protein
MNETSTIKAKTSFFIFNMIFYSTNHRSLEIREFLGTHNTTEAML